MAMEHESIEDVRSHTEKGNKKPLPCLFAKEKLQAVEMKSTIGW